MAAAVMRRAFWFSPGTLAAVLRCTDRTLHLCPPLCAGHNKWSKVKEVKIPKDAARGRMLAKYSGMIRVAVKEGGPNPEFNLTLAHLLEHCKNKNLPKAFAETAIKGAEKSKSSPWMVEARGPGGCLLLIEVLSDNNSRTQQDIRKILTRNGGMLSDGARNNFEKRGVVMVSAKDVNIERALELAIEAGAQDVQESEEDDEQVLKFICEMTEVRKVRTSLEQLDLPISSAGLEFLPRQVVLLDDDLLNTASSLIEELSDCPEVIRVWDNIEASS